MTKDAVIETFCGYLGRVLLEARLISSISLPIFNDFEYVRITSCFQTTVIIFQTADSYQLPYLRNALLL